MDCAEAKSQLEPYIAGRLQGPDREEFEQHLTACGECATAVGHLRNGSAPTEAAPDWTIEKIFGDGADGEEAAGAEATGHEGAADVDRSAPPDPTIGSLFGPAPDAGPSGPTPSAPDAAAPASAPAKPSSVDPGEEGWDFEPAGANVEGGPPEESREFAEKALANRGDPSHRRNAAVRAVVWGVGGIAGIGLLGASVWMAISVLQSPAPESTIPRVATFAPPIPSAVPPPVAHDSAAVADPAPAHVATGVDAPELPGATEAAGASPAKKAATPTPPPTKRVATSTPSPTPKAATIANTPRQGTSTTGASTPRREAPPVTKPSDRGADDMWPTDVIMPPPAAAPPPAVKPVVRDTPPVVESPPPAVASTVATGSAATGAATTPPPSPAIKAPVTTIDRLREATEKASGDADLGGLRRMREAWRNYLKSVVGPDRSPAKREYADCLWAIQLLSGRADDQRDALLAYRDFLLSAPAGGTDPRSAARLRQLEDVTAERR
jgi:hypothetical protein